MFDIQYRFTVFDLVTKHVGFVAAVKIPGGFIIKANKNHSGEQETSCLSPACSPL
jgi:hypothetical protein